MQRRLSKYRICGTKGCAKWTPQNSREGRGDRVYCQPHCLYYTIFNFDLLGAADWWFLTLPDLVWPEWIDRSTPSQMRSRGCVVRISNTEYL
ncbi:MAG: hypothetical protein ACLQUY_04405 [Ktedonobacterales bacterium]